MALSLKPDHLKRYGEYARLLIKHGRADWVRQIGWGDASVDGEAEPPREADAKLAQELASDLEKMGPTFVKLGQLLSSRADLLPMPYLEALSRLQDDVEPFAYEQVREIIQCELGRPVEELFREFERAPLAAASLGQVHRAKLEDGRRVVVKVQRPGIREQISRDFEVIDEVARFLDQHTEAGRRYVFHKQVAEMRRAVLSELDYRAEASNLQMIHENLKDFDLIVVPLPVDSLTTEHVLTMDFVPGEKVTSLPAAKAARINGSALAEQLFHAYLKQVLLDGFFHADPHGGNICVTPAGRLGVLDLGMVARLSPGVQQSLIKLLLAVSEGRGEDAGEIAASMAVKLGRFDRDAFRRRVADFVAHHQNVRIEQVQTGRVVMEIQRMAGESGARLPESLTMLGKTLLNLDRVGMILDPHFDPNAAIRRHAAAIMRQRVYKNLSAGHLFSMVLELEDFLQKLPARLNSVLDALARRDFKIEVDAIDEEHLLKGIHKIANRITAGLVLAALIIGAALLMRVQTSFTLLGYPGLAIILFGLAVAFGIVLVLRMIFQDARHERELRDHGHTKVKK